MATQVPYNPVPQVGEADSGPKGVQNFAIAEAFGAATAQATQNLGRQVEKAGDEMFARALALQQLDNDAAAKQADTDYMERTAQLHADFNSLRGANAKAALPGHVAALKAVREEIRDSLPNDAARKAYDGMSVPFMGRNIFNAAGHAASENKQYLGGTSKARVSAIESETLANSPDDAVFKENLGKVRDEITEQAALLGWGPDQLEHEYNAKVSSMWSNRIVGLSKNEPFKAWDMFEKNRKAILGQDQEKVEHQVRTQMRTVGARNISDSVNQGWAPYMKPTDIARANGVEDALIRVVKQAQRDNPDLEFTIGDKGGRRDQATQDALVAGGRSQTRNSDHLTGRAIDLIPLKNGVPDYNDREGMAKINEAMQRASEKLGIPLAEKSKSFTSWDPAHQALPKDYDVSKAPKPTEEPLQARVDRARNYARKTMSDDPMFEDVTQQRTIGAFNQNKALKRDFELTNRNTVVSAIIGGIGGKIPTTVDELRMDPEAAKAYDALPPVQQQRMNTALASNAKQDVVMDEKRLRRYQELKGLAESDPAAFVETDVIGEDLPRSVKKQLADLQVRKTANAEQDPRVNKALQILRPQLIPAGIEPSKKQEYAQFIGSLQDALTDFQAENKRPPKAEEIQVMGSRLLQERAGTGWFGTNFFRERTFGVSVPDAEREKIVSDPIWAERGITPTDEQVQRIYARKVYNQLYGKKKVEAEAKGQPVPSVPMSQ